MQKFRLIFFILLVSFVAAHAHAQDSKPFTSAEGGFSIDLAPPDGTETVGPVAETHSGGKRYTWESAKGVYDAGYLDLLPAVVPKLYVDNVARGMIDQAKSGGGTLKYKKDIALGDMTGVEIALTLKSGGPEFVFLHRIYATRGRAYILDALWPASQDGAAQTKVLDSFKLTGPVKSAAAPVPAAAAAAGPLVYEKGWFSVDLPTKPDEQTVTDAEPGGKLESKKDIALGEYPGIEIKVRLKEGVITILRYYMVNTRLFIVTTGWNSEAEAAAQLKIMDSFKILAPPAPTK